MPLYLWSVIGLCAGIYLFIQGFRLLQRRRLILDTPFSKIRSASLGMVEVSGLAAGPYTLLAPISTRACYYYRTVAWEWKQQGKSKQWVKVAGESMHVPFFLDDNTAKVMIDPRGADLDLHRDFQQEFCDGFFTTKQEAPPNVREFLLRHGVSTHNKIKVEEFCIKPKNALFILGTLDENTGLELTQQPILDEEHNTESFLRAFNFNPAGSGFSFRSLTRDYDIDDRLAASIAAPPAAWTRSAEVIRLSPEASPTPAAEMTQQQKISAALMKAGITNPAAWAAAGVGPTPSVASASAALGDFDSRPSVVLKKGKNNPTFIISWRSQRELANSLGWKCALMIWGGPVLALISLYTLLNLPRPF